MINIIIFKVFLFFFVVVFLLSFFKLLILILSSIHENILCSLKPFGELYVYIQNDILNQGIHSDRVININ